MCCRGERCELCLCLLAVNEFFAGIEVYGVASYAVLAEVAYCDVDFCRFALLDLFWSREVVQREVVFIKVANVELVHVNLVCKVGGGLYSEYDVRQGCIFLTEAYELTYPLVVVFCHIDGLHVFHGAVRLLYGYGDLSVGLGLCLVAEDECRVLCSLQTDFAGAEDGIAVVVAALHDEASLIVVG